MSTTRTRRALATVAGLTAGVTAATLVPSAAHAAPDPMPVPPEFAAAVERLRADIAKAKAEAATTTAAPPTCRGVYDYTPSNPTTWVPVPAISDQGGINCQLKLDDYDNAAVKVLQAALKECNGESALAVDADYGPQTHAAVKRVQERGGLPVDGVYDIDVKTRMEWPAYNRSNNAFVGCVDVPA
ncbi:peptidoglycan-binding domain-containing protein [Actinomycetes bacterium KLBMP 9797]